MAGFKRLIVITFTDEDGEEQEFTLEEEEANSLHQCLGRALGWTEEA